MAYKFQTLHQIIQVFGPGEKLKAGQIAERVGKNRDTVHSYLKELVEQGQLIKEGMTPHVFYKVAYQLTNQQSSKHIDADFNYKDSELLDESFLKFGPSGERMEGSEGFVRWCASRKVDPITALENYKFVYQQIEKLRNNYGLLPATKTFEKSIEKNHLDDILYADQYVRKEFGRGKLAELTFFAKQSQNKILLDEAIGLFIRKLSYFIKEGAFDAIAFIPPSIKRNLQILDRIDDKLTSGLPRVHLVKYYPANVIIPQKSLKKREERIMNAQNTIFVYDKKISDYQKVLLIDDFVGSGSTLNETAKKLKDLGVKEVIGFAIVGNLDMTYEVINEV